MHLFFDLDGTLTDSSAGMRNCYRHALEALGRPLPSDDRIRRCFGPPLAAAFQLLLETDDAELIEKAIATYRCRYRSIGLFQNDVYPGIVEGLQRLRGAGHRLRLVTAKPEPYAVLIAEHFRMAHLFDAVHAPSLADRTRTKADVLRTAVAAVGGATDCIVMIGDLPDDIYAARICGVRSIAAAWGFGVEHELRAAGPDLMARSMSEVVMWVEGQRLLSV